MAAGGCACVAGTGLSSADGNLLVNAITTGGTGIGGDTGGCGTDCERDGDGPDAAVAGCCGTAAGETAPDKTDDNGCVLGIVVMAGLAGLSVAGSASSCGERGFVSGSATAVATGMLGITCNGCGIVVALAGSEAPGTCDVPVVG